MLREVSAPDDVSSVGRTHSETATCRDGGNRMLSSQTSTVHRQARGGGGSTRYSGIKRRVGQTYRCRRCESDTSLNDVTRQHYNDVD